MIAGVSITNKHVIVRQIVSLIVLLGIEDEVKRLLEKRFIKATT